MLSVSSAFNPRAITRPVRDTISRSSRRSSVCIVGLRGWNTEGTEDEEEEQIGRPVRCSSDLRRADLRAHRVLCVQSSGNHTARASRGARAGVELGLYRRAQRVERRGYGGLRGGSDREICPMLLGPPANGRPRCSPCLRSILGQSHGPCETRSRGARPANRIAPVPPVPPVPSDSRRSTERP